jgi:protein arginine kinase
MDESSGMPAWNLETPTEWLRGEGEASDVVMSSRVRLARNLAGAPFVNKATRAQRQEVLDRCRVQIETCGLQPHIHWTELHHTEPMIRSLLVERHLISQQHARGKQASGAGGPDEPRGVAFTLPDERLAVMVNEEDHLRIQLIRSGLDLARTLEDAAAVDDRLESRIDYAFSPRFGYLTACPTNVGTGLRLSVMLHLPALRLTGNIDKAKRAAADMSLAVRGFYGEGSEAAGDLYQISNQTTLGKTEAMLLRELEQEIIPKVIDYERVARRTLLSKRRADIEDQVYRALGVLSNARLMTTEESMQLLSMVRLGCVAGLLPDLDVKVVNQMLLLTHPAHLQRAVGQELDQDQRRAARATLLRSRMVGPLRG